MQKSDAIKHFGSAQKLALACGLKSRQAIYLWPDEVPEKYQYRLFQATNGALALSPRLQLPAPTEQGHV
jgi:hypothetical protein